MNFLARHNLIIMKLLKSGFSVSLAYDSFSNLKFA